MEQILFDIAGNKYILVELVVQEKNHDKTAKKLKRFECIEQGVKEINKGTFWSPGYAILKILVPEKDIIEFNNSE